MRIPVTVVLSSTCIILLLACACADTSFGSRTPVGFGTSSEDQQVISCLKAKYGEPCSEGAPRFIEPIVATALDERNLPKDSVMMLNKDAPKIFFWVFFDRFQPKDPVTLSMKYLPTGRVVDSVEKTPDGNCGAIHAEYLMPDGGWPSGGYEITISGRGVAATRTFTVSKGDTQTEPLLYSAEMCPGASGTITAVTRTSAGLAAAATGTAGQFSTTVQTTGAGKQAGYAQPSFSGCWALDSSRCGPTTLQLTGGNYNMAGEEIFVGYMCDHSTAVHGTAAGNSLTGTWGYIQGSAGSSCCRLLMGRYTCDPVCQSQQSAENFWGGSSSMTVESGRIDLTMNPSDRSLEGEWGTGTVTPRTPVHGTPSGLCDVTFVIGSNGQQS